MVTNKLVIVEEPALKNDNTPNVVEVALLVVAFNAVKFWSVEEPVSKRFAADKNPRFAVIPPATIDPPVIVRPFDEERPAVAHPPSVVDVEILASNKLVSVVVPAFRNVVTPKVVEVAFVVVAFSAVKLRSVEEPVSKRFPSVARLLTTSCEVEAVLVTPRNDDVALMATRLSEIVVEANKFVVVAVWTVKNPEPEMPICKRLPAASTKSCPASSTAVPSAK